MKETEIYTVEIKKDGETISYTTLSAILATVTYRSELSKFIVSSPISNETVDTETEACELAENSITEFLKNVFAVPEFIKIQ